MKRKKSPYDFVEQGRENILKRWKKYPTTELRRKQTAFGGFMSMYYSKGEDTAIAWLQKNHGTDPDTVERVLMKFQTPENLEKIALRQNT